MKRLLIATTLLCGMALRSARAQNTTNTLESKIWAPTFGSQHAPVDPGPYSDHLLNTTGQVMTVLGASVYEDNGASTLQRMYTSDGVECLSAPVTGSMTYTVASLNPCQVQPGQALFVKANLDGFTQQFKVNLTIVHPGVNGTETAASNIPTSSSVSVNTGCGQITGSSSNPTCSITVPSGVATTSFVVATFLSPSSPPVVTDNGTQIPPYAGYPQGPFGGLGSANGSTSYSSLYVVQNESVGSHTFVSSGAGQAYPAIEVINLKKPGSTGPVIDGSTSPYVYPSVVNNTVTCNAVSPSIINEFVLAYFQNSDITSSPSPSNLTAPPSSFGQTSLASFAYGATQQTSPFTPSYTGPENGSTGLCVTMLIK